MQKQYQLISMEKHESDCSDPSFRILLDIKKDQNGNLYTEFELNPDIDHSSLVDLFPLQFIEKYKEVKKLNHNILLIEVLDVETYKGDDKVLLKAWYKESTDRKLEEILELPESNRKLEKLMEYIVSITERKDNLKSETDKVLQDLLQNSVPF